jgi:hypothetical protein
VFYDHTPRDKESWPVSLCVFRAPLQLSPKHALPWLVLALLGGFITVRVLGYLKGQAEHGNLFVLR